MRLRSDRHRTIAGVLLTSLLCAGCAQESERLPEIRLFRQAKIPVELVSGDTIATGDRLYLTVITSRPFYIYVLSEDATGGRWIIHPCQRWGQSRPLGAGRLHRLPLPVLGQESFWPVRNVTRRERLLVLASERPFTALDAAARDALGPEPCVATLRGDAHGWFDRAAESGASGRSGHRAWRADTESRVWISTYDLAGALSHEPRS